jgi:hypothetical protein
MGEGEIDFCKCKNCGNLGGFHGENKDFLYHGRERRTNQEKTKVDMN